ncbi:hypothetical protein QEH52_11665 [Coraliomargarita sp. SDUM461003]|uniref:Uncharacterized protein n=1 Tax=Thalassobacterium maritimum TaxID=3041265 RepID=A0ABU1AVJ4_9BACT|nr:hypothetical protein [Coraliomargarita sp. SDUM461003]MDQ8208170.1 hypothetical protein [Coraliomargarita sp. SDUM461003]
MTKTTELKPGSPHPTNPDLVYLGKSINDFGRRWGSPLELAMIRDKNRRRARKKWHIRKQDCPSKLVFKKLKKAFPSQSYGDESTDWDGLDKLFQLRDRLNREHPSEKCPIFQIRRKVSPRLGGLFTLENSYLTVDPYFEESHVHIAESAYRDFQLSYAVKNNR